MWNFFLSVYNLPSDEVPSGHQSQVQLNGVNKWMSDHLQVLLDDFGWSCGLSLILQLTLFVDEFIGSVLCTERFLFRHSSFSLSSETKS